MSADFPTPRFRIGDAVFYPTTTSSAEDLPCPDCLGTRRWKVITPAGREMEAECQRCCRTFRSDGLPPLKRLTYHPHVQALTVGSVRIDTAERDRSPVSYMCCETGVGSGAVYEENRLCGSREEAEARAAEMAAEAQAKADAKPHAEEARRFAHLTIIDASIAQAKQEEMRSRWRVEDLIVAAKDALEMGAPTDIAERLQDAIAAATGEDA